MIGHGSEGATALFDMPGFVVRAHVVDDGEWWLKVETTADSVAQVAREFGIGWHTAMAAVREHGERLVEDPQRLGAPSALGLDETSFLRAGPKHPTVMIAGFVDLDRHQLLDVAEGRSGQVVRDWLDARPSEWVQAIDVAVIDPFRGYATGLTDRLDATIVVEHFHAIGLANKAIDARRCTRMVERGRSVGATDRGG